MIYTFITALAVTLLILWVIAMGLSFYLNRYTVWIFRMHNWLAAAGPLSILWLGVRFFA